MRLGLPITAAAVLVLTGCVAPSLEGEPTPAAPEVSPACAAGLVDLEELDPGASFEDEDALILASLEECANADEYLLAVHNNPESWLYDADEDIDPQILFLSACGVDGADATDVCIDAAAQGLLD
jgi:hypothetical protein